MRPFSQDPGVVKVGAADGVTLNALPLGGVVVYGLIVATARVSGKVELLVKQKASQVDQFSLTYAMMVYIREPEILSPLPYL